MKRLVMALALCAACGRTTTAPESAAPSAPPAADPTEPTAIVLGTPRSVELVADDTSAVCLEGTTDLAGNFSAGFEDPGTPRHEKYWGFDGDGTKLEGGEAGNGKRLAAADGFFLISETGNGVMVEAHDARGARTGSSETIGSSLVASTALADEAALLLSGDDGARVVLLDADARTVATLAFEGENPLALAVASDALFLLTLTDNGRLARWIDAGGAAGPAFSLPASCADDVCAFTRVQPVIGGVLIDSETPSGLTWDGFIAVDETRMVAPPAWLPDSDPEALVPVSGGTAYAEVPAASPAIHSITYPTIVVVDAAGDRTSVLDLSGDGTMWTQALSIGRDGTVIALRVGQSGTLPLCHWDLWPALLK